MGSTESDLVTKAEAFLASAKSFKGDRIQRRDLLKQMDLLYLEIEEPMDSLMRQWSFMNASAAIDVMVKSGGFEKIPKQGSISAKELGPQINIEPTVLARIMRMLTASGVLALTGEDEYAHTSKSYVYLRSAAADFWNMCINMSASYRSWPEYFKTKTNEELLDLRKTPYSFAYGEEGKTFYEILTLDTDRLNMFNKCMMQQDLNLPTLGMFPFTSLKDEVIAEPERAFVVDIAGGRGHCLMLIKQETSDVFGTDSKMILEDRPPVLDTIPADELPGVEKIGYDFYTEQPIMNAHIYWLRRILHNYQDEVCIKILGNIASAMGPNSRLLIAEALIPAQTTTGEDMGAYLMDMVMISIGGKERNEKEYMNLLDAVGLELVKIWPFVVGAQVVLECRLKRT